MEAFTPPPVVVLALVNAGSAAESANAVDPLPVVFVVDIAVVVIAVVAALFVFFFLLSSYVLGGGRQLFATDIVQDIENRRRSLYPFPHYILPPTRTLVAPIRLQIPSLPWLRITHRTRLGQVSHDVISPAVASSSPADDKKSAFLDIAACQRCLKRPYVSPSRSVRNPQ